MLSKEQKRKLDKMVRAYRERVENPIPRTEAQIKGDVARYKIAMERVLQRQGTR